MTMNHRHLSKRLRMASIVATLALALFSTGAVAAQSTVLQKAQKDGVMRIGFANEIPYDFIGKDNKLTGMSPSILRVVLKRLGVDHMDGVLADFGALIPGLNAGRWDIVAAGMFITPARCKQAAFSIPVYRMGEDFLVKKGNPKNLHSYKDVANNASAILAVEAGAVEVGYAKKAGIPDSRIKQLPDQASLLAAVRSGRADAAALTAPSIRRMAMRGGPGVEAVEDFHNTPDEVGYGALVFRKGEDALREAVNAELRKFLGTKEHLALVKPFGFTAANVPAKGVTTAELCKGERGAELLDD